MEKHTHIYISHVGAVYALKNVRPKNEKYIEADYAVVLTSSGNSYGSEAGNLLDYIQFGGFYLTSGTLLTANGRPVKVQPRERVETITVRDGYELAVGGC